MRVSRYRLDRPSVVASLLDTWDCESKIIQKWWADSAAEKKRLRDLIEGYMRPSTRACHSLPIAVASVCVSIVGDALGSGARIGRG